MFEKEAAKIIFRAQRVFPRLYFDDFERQAGIRIRVKVGACEREREISIRDDHWFGPRVDESAIFNINWLSFFLFRECAEKERLFEANVFDCEVRDVFFGE